MIHYFENNKSGRTLVLLHGTGADEHDLVPLAKMVDKDANILSLRGRVSENGMLRFFKRLDMHTFDLASVDEESDVVLAFLKEAKSKYKLKELVLLGYSNGASMIEALLLKEERMFSGAILLQPGYLKQDITFPVNKGLRVFISVSDNDPYLTVPNQKALIRALDESYELSITRHHNGHGLTNDILNDVRKWLKF